MYSKVFLGGGGGGYLGKSVSRSILNICDSSNLFQNIASFESTNATSDRDSETEEMSLRNTVKTMSWDPVSKLFCESQGWENVCLFGTIDSKSKKFRQLMFFLAMELAIKI